MATALKVIFPYLIAYCAMVKIIEAVWLGSRHLILQATGLSTKGHRGPNLDSLLSIYTELVFQSILLLEIAWLVTNAAKGRRKCRRMIKKAKWNETCVEYAGPSLTVLAG